MKRGQVLGRHQQLYRSGLAGRQANQTETFELDDHLVDAGRRDAEEAPEVHLGGRLAVEQDVRVDERQLVTMMLGGKGAIRRLERAQILLAADDGSTDEEIARNVAIGTSTVYRTKQRFVEEGLDRALSELPRPGAARGGRRVATRGSRVLTAA